LPSNVLGAAALDVVDAAAIAPTAVPTRAGFTVVEAAAAPVDEPLKFVVFWNRT